jgi:hypothetical protein
MTTTTTQPQAVRLASFSGKRTPCEECAVFYCLRAGMCLDEAEVEFIVAAPAPDGPHETEGKE